MTTPDNYSLLYAQIGEAASLWGSLEQGLRSFVYDLATIQNSEFSNQDDDSAFVTVITLLGHMDGRQLVASAKVLAHWASSEIPDFYPRAEKVLNYIDADLRNQRNRYMHDQWYIWGAKIGRIQGGSVIKKEHGTGAPKFQFHRKTEYESIEATGQLAKDIRTAISDLDGLGHEVRQAALRKWPQPE